VRAATTAAIILAIPATLGATLGYPAGVRASAKTRTEAKMTPRTPTAKANGPTRLAIMDIRMVIVKLRDGTLMGCFSRAADNGQEAAARYSRDNGRTWSDPQTLFRLPQNSGVWGLSEALVDREGEVHLFILNAPTGDMIASGEGERVLTGELAGQRLDIWYAKSARGRTEWPPPRLIWKGYTGALNSVIQMTNGRIVLPFSYLTSRTWAKRGEGLDAFTFMGQFDSTAIYSDDGGATWRLGSSVRVSVPDIVSAYGAVEPVIIQLKDGRVWMLIRTQLGRFYESFSEDGAAWSDPRPTTILSSDSPAGIVRVPDGRIVLFWNDCLRFPYAYGGRHVLHAAISDDEGKTWRGYREVARDPKRNEPPPPNGDFGTAYPFPAVTNEGTIIYCTGQGAGRELLMLLDPDWLLETSQKADFGKGADEWSVFGTKGVEFVPHPEKPNARVLSMRKTDPAWPAAAVWNFPAAREGRVRMRMMIEPGFKGTVIGITDHFSAPFDMEDRFYNVFNLEIGPGGRLLEQAHLVPSRWHELVLEWSHAKRQCRVRLDGRAAGTLPLLRETTGLCYLRMRSTAEGTDAAGFLVESFEARITEARSRGSNRSGHDRSASR